jgi:hypothetical protein
MAIGQLGLRADYIATLQAIDPNQRIRCEGYVRAKRDRPTNGPANTRSASRYFFFGLAGLAFLGACGVGGVFSIRRSTSSSLGVWRLVMVRVCHG